MLRRKRSRPLSNSPSLQCQPAIPASVRACCRRLTAVRTLADALHVCEGRDGLVDVALQAMQVHQLIQQCRLSDRKDRAAPQDALRASALDRLAAGRLHERVARPASGATSAASIGPYCVRHRGRRACSDPSRLLLDAPRGIAQRERTEQRVCK